MKTYHVGGINPLNRCKTMTEALDKVRDDDTIELHKNIVAEDSFEVENNVIINGNDHTITVKSGKVGLLCTKPVEIHSIIFKVEARANAIYTNQHLVMDSIRTEIVGPIREMYPVIKVDANENIIPKLDATNCALQMVNTDYGVQASFDHCSFASYYEGDVALSNRVDMSRITGDSHFTNCLLRSMVIGTTVQDDDGNIIPYGESLMEHCTILKYVDIDSKATIIDPNFDIKEEGFNEKAYKREPENGPLANRTEAKYAIHVRPGGTLVLNNYVVSQCDQSFLGLYADHATISIENTKCSERMMNHKVVNSTISFNNVHDENYWAMDACATAYVRSKVNSNVHYETATEKLNKMIGQDTVKNQINTIMNTIEMNRDSNDRNFDFSYNMIFAGNPGTGKSTVARTMAQALFEVGAIPQNKFTQATSDEFVKGYVGQTGENTRRILDGALGGVLFIDEAYELTVKDDQNSFNSEVISVLIRYMEEHRSDLVVIAAGYNKEMKEFLASNVGLDRRFQWIQFEDYDNHQMAEIFEQMRKSYGDEYATADIQPVIEPLFQRLTTTNLSIPDAKGRVNNGGNGGLVRNVYQACAQARNNRVMSGTNETKLLTMQDIAAGFKSQIQKALNRRI